MRSLSLPERLQLAERLRTGASARALHRARRAGKELWALIHKNSLALPMLVEILDPDSDMDAAFHRLADRLDALRVEIEGIVERTDARCEAERGLWRDHIDAAIIERNRISGEIVRVEDALWRVSGAYRRRKGKTAARLEDLPDDPPPDPDALRARRAVLHRARDRLGVFMRTLDVSVLPPGFEALVEQQRLRRAQKKTPTG